MTLYFFQLFGGVFLVLVLTWWIGDYGIDGIVAAVNRLIVFVQHHESRSPDGDGHRAGLGAAVGDSVDSGVSILPPQQGHVHARDGNHTAGAPPALTDERRAGSEPADSHSVLSFEQHRRLLAAVSMGRERRL